VIITLGQMLLQTLTQRYVIAGAVVLMLWLLACLAAVSMYKGFFGPEVSAAWRTRRRLGLAIVTFVLGAAAVLTRVFGVVRAGEAFAGRDNFHDRINDELGVNTYECLRVVVLLASRALAVGLAMALAVKLYEKWVNHQMSEAERATGKEGVRAWLSRGNVIVAATLALFVWLGFDNSFWGTLIGAVGLLVAYPIITTLLQPAAAAPVSAVAVENLSPERERVLRMLEAGKISAEESAELLAALAATVPLPLPAEPWTPARKLMAFGAALVLIGFFLPWFEFDPVKEVVKVTQNINGQVRTMVGDREMFPIPSTDLAQVHGTTVTLRGGDVQHGLGWLVLIFGVVPAAVPYVVVGLRRESRRLFMIVSVAAGGILALYLLTSQLSAVSFGLPIVLAGYAVEAIGLFREHERTAASAWPASPVIAA
jgi:hypothetical protein